MEYVQLYKSESHGSYGLFGIKILISGNHLPDLSDVPNAIRNAAYKAADLVSAEVQAAALSLDESAQAAAKKQRQELIALFPGKIFVEEIPNGYCSQWCCRHLPWFIVTTEIGRFKIGWRKRVINIDWSDTTGKFANELFYDEKTTRGDKYIHAWSLEDAKRYIVKIIKNAN